MKNEEYFQKIKEKFIRLKKEITQELSRVDRSKHNHLQNYIYFAHHPIFSFTESILILCENHKSNSAKVLLRSLFEAHIDVIYHQLGDTEQRLAFSAKTMFDERLIVLREILNLIKKYPNQESTDPKDLFSKSYLNKTISDQAIHKEAILRANPNLSGTKHLQQKARLCEEGGVKNAKKGHFEKMYSLIYRYLSPMTHLNIEGLQAFIGQDESGAVFFHDGNDEVFIATQAIDISIAFSKDLYDNKILNGEKIEIIKDIEETISSENIDFEGGPK